MHHYDPVCTVLKIKPRPLMYAGQVFYQLSYILAQALCGCPQ